MRRLPAVFVLGFMLTVLPALPALAWSGLGHRMVGELAQRHLNPAAKAEVEAEFRLAGFSLLSHQDFLPGCARMRVYVLRKVG